MPFSATTRITRIPGSDSVPIQPTNNWTKFYSRYDHSLEVSPDDFAFYGKKIKMVKEFFLELVHFKIFHLLFVVIKISQR